MVPVLADRCITLLAAQTQTTTQQQWLQHLPVWTHPYNITARCFILLSLKYSWSHRTHYWPGVLILPVPKYSPKGEYMLLWRKHALSFPPSQQQNSGLKPTISSERTAPKPSVTKEENRALKELWEDHSRVILTVDKGMAVVVLDKQDNIHKAQDLLLQ